MKSTKQFENLKSAVFILKRAADTHALTADEARGMIDIIHDFAHALDVLDGYDHESLNASSRKRD
ncbi:MAG: hypothetical protein ABIW76_20300 [Fibrobacteria bacterium]